MRIPILHRPRKRFGQNFLEDRAVVQQIVDAISPKPDERLVEIGPGMGALTAPLLERVTHLDVIEIDRDLAQELRGRYPKDRLTVHDVDALEVDFSKFGHVRVVGNLPYNISTPLLFHITENAARV